MTIELTTKNGASVKITYNENIYFLINNTYKIENDVFGSIREIENNKFFIGHIKRQPVDISFNDNDAAIFRDFHSQAKEKYNLEREKKYQFLIDKLPSINIEYGNDDERCKKLISEANSITFFKDREMEGVNIGLENEYYELIMEAQKNCNHDIEDKITLDYTLNGYKKVIKTKSCNKCGLHKQVSVTEDVY